MQQYNATSEKHTSAEWIKMLNEAAKGLKDSGPMADNQSSMTVATMNLGRLTISANFSHILTKLGIINRDGTLFVNLLKALVVIANKDPRNEELKKAIGEFYDQV